MATTANAEALKEALAHEQQRLTNQYINVITEAQAYSFGVIIDDVSESHVEADKGVAIIEEFLSLVFSQNRCGLVRCPRTDNKCYCPNNCDYS